MNHIEDGIESAQGSGDTEEVRIKVSTGTTVCSMFNMQSASALAFIAKEINTGSLIKHISPGAFQPCTDELKTVVLPNVTEIQENAFAGKTALLKVVAPKVVRIESQAFAGVGTSTDGKTEIYISGDVDWSSHPSAGFASDALSGFKGTLNCGFAEGQVSGAPWGAQASAIINYNVPTPTE